MLLSSCCYCIYTLPQPSPFPPKNEIIQSLCYQKLGFAYLLVIYYLEVGMVAYFSFFLFFEKQMLAYLNLPNTIYFLFIATFVVDKVVGMKIIFGFKWIETLMKMMKTMTLILITIE